MAGASEDNTAVLEVSGAKGAAPGGTAGAASPAAHSLLQHQKDEPAPLTPQGLDAYVRDGFVLLPQAFSPDVAAACREKVWAIMEETGVSRDDPSTWPVKFPLAFVFEEGHGEPWASVFTSRLKRAIDQLCGEGAWEPFGCGWWMVTFPGHHSPDSWGIDGHWHIDGVSRRRCIHSQEVGVVPILLFSDVHPLGGGTALCRGSHHHVARLLHGAGPGGMDAVPLIQQAQAHAEAVWRYKPGEVVEARGRAGDVVFTHPFLVHARSTNCASPAPAGGEGVRFMCHPGVRLRAHPSFGVENGHRTPGEEGVTAGLGAAAEVFPHESCVAEWAKQREEEEEDAALSLKEQQPLADDHANARPEEGGREEDSQEAEEDSLPEGVDRDLWAAMGMAGFGRQAKRTRKG